MKLSHTLLHVILKPPLVAGTTGLCFTDEETEASLQKAKELAQNTEVGGCGVAS